MRTTFGLRQRLLAVSMIFAVPSIQIAHAEIHGLVMSISAYGHGIEPLPGVAKDRSHIREMARRIGIKDSQLLWYEDGQLTLAGMNMAFDELDRRVQPGDQFFVFYSGHGGRGLVREPTGEQRCAESLVSVDGKMFVDAELEKRLKRLSGRSSKAIVFIDACHSGGVTTRGLGERPKRLRPRFTELASGGSSCAKPVNTFTRGLAAAGKGTALGNYVYIAASKDNEVSMDDEDNGGLATASWFKCLNGDAVDADHSGGLTAEEIRVCAQQNVDNSLTGVPGVLPHHITITGNRDIVLSLKTETATGQSSTTSPLSALRDIYNARDQRRSVSLSANNRKLKIGRDSISFTLQSRESGYVYLLMAGAADNSFDLIFPNKLDQNNFIQAGQTTILPQQTWEIAAQGPAGKDEILAIVADSPRDFSSLGLQPAGPFSVIPASMNSAASVQKISGASAFSNSPDCVSTSATRALVVRPAKCSNAYGAALLEIEEIY